MEYSCRRCGIDTGGFVGHTCNVITYPAHHTSPEKEVSQEQETVDDKLSKPDNSYIDQVVEEPVVKNGYVGKFAGYKMGDVTLTVEEIEAYEAGKTTERQRIREIVEEERIEGARLFDIGSEFACPRDYRREGNNALIDRLLSRLDV